MVFDLHFEPPLDPAEDALRAAEKPERGWRFYGEAVAWWRLSYTRWTGGAVGGVAGLASMFLRLKRGDWRRRPAAARADALALPQT